MNSPTIFARCVRTKVRPVLACRMTIAADGTIEEDIEFFAATIESKAKLAYDDVSDWLENTGSWSTRVRQHCRTNSSVAPRLPEPQRMASNSRAGLLQDRPTTVLCWVKKVKC